MMREMRGGTDLWAASRIFPEHADYLGRRVTGLLENSVTRVLDGGIHADVHLGHAHVTSRSRRVSIGYTISKIV